MIDAVNLFALHHVTATFFSFECICEQAYAALPMQLQRLQSILLLPLLVLQWLPSLSDVRRWSRAYATFGPQQLLFHFRMRGIRSCVACGRLILPGEKYYECGHCNDYNVCASCHRDTVQRPSACVLDRQHCMFLEHEVLVVNVQPLLAKACCTADALMVAFSAYAQRPCLGHRPQEGHTGHTTSSLCGEQVTRGLCINITCSNRKRGNVP